MPVELALRRLSFRVYRAEVRELGRALIGVRQRGGRSALGATQDVVAGVGRDPQQPGAEDASPVRADRLVGVDERVLRRVGRLVGVVNRRHARP